MHMMGIQNLSHVIDQGVNLVMIWCFYITKKGEHISLVQKEDLIMDSSLQDVLAQLYLFARRENVPIGSITQTYIDGFKIIWIDN